MFKRVASQTPGTAGATQTETMSEPRDIMSETPRCDAVCSPGYYSLIATLARQLERELAQAQARYAEIEKDAARYRHVRAKPHMLLHLKNSEFDAAIDAALKEPR